MISSVAGRLSPLGMGPVAAAKAADPKQIATFGDDLLIAGGRSGIVQRVRGEELSSVFGRYPQFDSTGSLARFRDYNFGSVGGVAVDETMALAYITEESKNKIHVISLSDQDEPNSWTLETLAGNGEPGFVDGPLAEARFRSPSGLLLRGAVLYVADTGNHIIRAIDLPSGQVSTIAGTPERRGYFGDGAPATAALLFAPKALTLCRNGDMFIADTGNHWIRRLDASTSVLTTVLGDGVAASSGEGRPAYVFPVSSPLGVACDDFGNVFATSAHSVRLLPADDRGIVDGSGVVQTIYGAAPRLNFSESITRCLSGIVSVDDAHVKIADSCTGMLIEMERRPQ